MDKKIFRSVALGIVIGCLATYFSVYFLQILGVTTIPIRDDWGAFLSLLVVIVGGLSMSNKKTINRIVTLIEKNSADDKDTVLKINRIDRRLVKIETKMGIDTEEK